MYWWINEQTKSEWQKFLQLKENLFSIKGKLKEVKNVGNIDRTNGNIIDFIYVNFWHDM